jgi:hypothetical protein
MDEQKIEFSARASLVARGVRFQQMGIWAEVSAQVKIKEKAYKHTPLEKLFDCLINITLPVNQRPTATSILGRSTVTVAQLLRPFPQFGAVVSYSQNEAHSSYHSFQLTAWRRFGEGLTFSAAYSFSKSIDDLSSMSLNNQGSVSDLSICQ